MDTLRNIVRAKISPIYVVKFKDGTSFEGGSFEVPRWSKCPLDKEIEELELYLPNSSGDKICLAGYEQYNFLVGVSKTLNNNVNLVGHMYGLGKFEENVISYRITLIATKGMKYKVGDITVRTFFWGKEGVGRTSTSGWKKGIKN